jgi:hypothetical protein
MCRPTFRRMVLAPMLVALIAIVPPPAASAKTRPTCERPGSKTVAENAVARLFTRPLPQGGRDLLGCWKKRGRAGSLTALHEHCSLSGDLELVRLRGRFAAFYINRTDRYLGLSAGCRPSNKLVEHFVHVVDLRRSRNYIYEIDGRPAGGRLLLDARGGIAWPSWLPHNQVAVRVIDSDGIRSPNARPEELWGRVLDLGAIHPESLKLSRGELNWVNDGIGRSARLAGLHDLL